MTTLPPPAPFNCIIGAPNWIDADPTFASVQFSGGEWLPSLPLTNLRNPFFVNVAQAVDLTLTSTQFWVDLGAPRNTQLTAIPFLAGVSMSCRYRVRWCTSQDASTAVYDTGWQDYFPAIYGFGTQPWYSPTVWNGRIAPEDAAKFPQPIIAVNASPLAAQFELWEFDDTVGNTSGYLAVPRLFSMPGAQFSLNLIYGAQFDWEDPSIVSTSLGGVDMFEILDGFRTLKFGFDYLTEDEALSTAMSIKRRLGISGQLFFIFNPTDTVQLSLRSFPARFRIMEPLEYASYGRMRATFEIKEIIG